MLATPPTNAPVRGVAWLDSGRSLPYPSASLLNDATFVWLGGLLLWLSIRT